MPRLVKGGKWTYGWVVVGRVLAPRETRVKRDDRLLTVRGSRCGLGFATRGPIYLKALEHPELELFGEER